MSKLPLFVIVVMAASFWISAIVLLVLGLKEEHLGVLKWVALIDGVAAVVFSWMAARRWTNG